MTVGGLEAACRGSSAPKGQIHGHDSRYEMLGDIGLRRAISSGSTRGRAA